MSTTADVVFEAFRTRIAETVLPIDDVASGWDKFTVVPSLDALIGNERDRVIYMQLVQGPYPKVGVRCVDVLRLAVGPRYFSEFLSLGRMLRDLPVLRERMRSAVAPNIPGLQKVEIAPGPLYDVTTLAKAVIPLFDVTLEYHVEV